MISRNFLRSQSHFLIFSPNFLKIATPILLRTRRFLKINSDLFAFGRPLSSIKHLHYLRPISNPRLFFRGLVNFFDFANSLIIFLAKPFLRLDNTFKKSHDQNQDQYHFLLFQNRDNTLTKIKIKINSTPLKNLVVTEIKVTTP